MLTARTGVLWADGGLPSISAPVPPGAVPPHPGLWVVTRSSRRIWPGLCTASAPWINANAHPWGKAVSRRTIHLPRRDNWPVDLSTGLYFVVPWATSQANINDRKPLKRNKHLSKTYLFFVAKQLLMGFVTSLEKLKGKLDLRSPLALAEGKCRMHRAVSETSVNMGAACELRRRWRG